MSQNDLVSVTAAAAMLGVSNRTVLRWIRNGDLTAQRLGPATSAWLLDRASVDGLVEKRRTELRAELAALSGPKSA